MLNVIGLGYIGLPTALMFAAHGVPVIGSDYNKELVLKLQQGKVSFEEKGLPELFQKASENGIQFSTEYAATDTYIIAVPSPYDKVSRKIDPSYIITALKSVLEVCNDDAVVIIESTVSPGAIDRHVRPIVQSSEKGINLVHAPERIIPGNMVQELMHNSRTIGADDSAIGNKVKELYTRFCQGEIIVTDIRTAEMTKVVENTYRDINIAYANELAKICRSDNMDVYEIIRIANKHPRVNVLQPGPGVGGHCISVDPWFLVGDYPGLANIILAARKINDSMPAFVLERIGNIMEKEGVKSVSRVGLYGLTYKEDVDDTRESPTIQLLEQMKRNLATGIKVYDPWVEEDLVPNQYHDIDEFLDAVDLVVIMVGHGQIHQDKEKLANKIVLDTKNIGIEGAYLL